MRRAAFRRSRTFAVVALLVISGWAAPVAAQVTTADVVGVVMDSSGGRLPGVTITARNVATGQQQRLRPIRKAIFRSCDLRPAAIRSAQPSTGSVPS